MWTLHLKMTFANYGKVTTANIPIICKKSIINHEIYEAAMNTKEFVRNYGKCVWCRDRQPWSTYKQASSFFPFLTFTKSIVRNLLF